MTIKNNDNEKIINLLEIINKKQINPPKLKIINATMKIESDPPYIIYNLDYLKDEFMEYYKKEEKERRYKQKILSNLFLLLIFVPFFIELFRVHIPHFVTVFLLYFLWGWFITDLHKYIEEW